MSYPFDPQHGPIIVPTTLSGPRGEAIVPLALDTGATYTTLNTSLLVRLGYDLASEIRQIQVITASGIEHAPLIEVEKVEALGFERIPFQVLGLTLPPSSKIYGVLGLNFLRGRRLTIDFPAGLLTLE